MPTEELLVLLPLLDVAANDLYRRATYVRRIVALDHVA
jgi:hypothetical protein